MSHKVLSSSRLQDMLSVGLQTLILAGIYIGAFGHHGLEVLQLQRAIGEVGIHCSK